MSRLLIGERFDQDGKRNHIFDDHSIWHFVSQRIEQRNDPRYAVNSAIMSSLKDC